MDVAELERRLQDVADRQKPVDVAAGRAGVDRRVRHHRQRRVLTAAAVVVLLAAVGALVVATGDDEQGLDVQGPGETYLVPALDDGAQVRLAQTGAEARTRSIEDGETSRIWVWTPDGSLPTVARPTTGTPYLAVRVLDRSARFAGQANGPWERRDAVAPGATTSWSRPGPVTLDVHSRGTDPGAVEALLPDLAAAVVDGSVPVPTIPGMLPAVTGVELVDLPGLSVPFPGAEPSAGIIVDVPPPAGVAPEAGVGTVLVTSGDERLVGLELLLARVGEEGEATARTVEVGGAPAVLLEDPLRLGPTGALLWVQDGRGVALSIRSGWQPEHLATSPEAVVVGLAEGVHAVDQAGWDALVARVADHPTNATGTTVPGSAVATVAEPPGS